MAASFALLGIRQSAKAFLARFVHLVADLQRGYPYRLICTALYATTTPFARRGLTVCIDPFFIAP